MMRVWTNKKFDGYWPVPTAAVVVADSQEKALERLNEALKEINLGPTKLEHMVELPMLEGHVVILSSGDY